MPHKCNTKMKKSYQSGVTLIEVSFALIMLAFVMTLDLQENLQSLKQEQAMKSSQFITQIVYGAIAYLKQHPQLIDKYQADHVYSLSFDNLKNNGYLSPTLQDSNQWGQQVKLFVKKSILDTPKHSQVPQNILSLLLVTTGGQSTLLPFLNLSELNLGVIGGVINDQFECGVYKNWKLYPKNWLTVPFEQNHQIAFISNINSFSTPFISGEPSNDKYKISLFAAGQPEQNTQPIWYPLFTTDSLNLSWNSSAFVAYSQVIILINGQVAHSFDTKATSVKILPRKEWFNSGSHTHLQLKVIPYDYNGRAGQTYQTDNYEIKPYQRALWNMQLLAMVNLYNPDLSVTQNDIEIYPETKTGICPRPSGLAASYQDNSLPPILNDAPVTMLGFDVLGINFQAVTNHFEQGKFIIPKTVILNISILAAGKDKEIKNALIFQVNGISNNFTIAWPTAGRRQGKTLLLPNNIKIEAKTQLKTLFTRILDNCQDAWNNNDGNITVNMSSRVYSKNIPIGDENNIQKTWNISEPAQAWQPILFNIANG